ncbi:hypothetical protein NL676_013949 [Syzygium grande]|nr:hypothetical protein NL676_013949 [Syzygium grande]
MKCSFVTIAIIFFVLIVSYLLVNQHQIVSPSIDPSELYQVTVPDRHCVKACRNSKCRAAYKQPSYGACTNTRSCTCLFDGHG